MALVLQDEVNGIKRLGVGMVGPIQLKLRYQGIIRNVLIEDPVTPGTPVEYDVWDDLGQAYIMSGTEGEVRVTPFEGKRVPVRFFRIASRPGHPQGGPVLPAHQRGRAGPGRDQAGHPQAGGLPPDGDPPGGGHRLRHPAGPHGHPEPQRHRGLGYLTPGSLYAAVAMTDLHEIESAALLVNPFDFRDFYRWDINQTGWAIKDRVVAGEKITTFGEFQIQRSIIVPQGKVFLLPEPNFLGVFPVLYSLDVEENHNVEAFWKGWVFDEMVSMAILNPRGIATITKTEAIEHTTDKDVLGEECIGPDARGGNGKCGALVNLSSAKKKDTPPLCEKHAKLATEFVPTVDVTGDKQTTKWVRVTMGRREKEIEA
jgi:hypothetical protein